MSKGKRESFDRGRERQGAYAIRGEKVVTAKN